MTIQALTDFFMWCSIINGGMLLYAVILSVFAPDFLYRTQSWFFPLERDKFNAIYYAFLGGYKILFLVFCLVPYIALLIIG